LQRLSAPLGDHDDIPTSMAAHRFGLDAIGTTDRVLSNVVWRHLVRAMSTVLGTVGYSLATLAVLAIIGAAEASSLAAF
jgi:hypothetical protein